MTYQARVATFTFEADFAYRRQTAFSELVLVELPTRYFKARNTAPAAQAAVAESSVLALLEKVNWAY